MSAARLPRGRGGRAGACSLAVGRASAGPARLLARHGLAKPPAPRQQPWASGCARPRPDPGPRCPRARGEPAGGGKEKKLSLKVTPRQVGSGPGRRREREMESAVQTRSRRRCLPVRPVRPSVPPEQGGQAAHARGTRGCLPATPPEVPPEVRAQAAGPALCGSTRPPGWEEAQACEPRGQDLVCVPRVAVPPEPWAGPGPTGTQCAC